MPADSVEGVPAQLIAQSCCCRCHDRGWLGLACEESQIRHAHQRQAHPKQETPAMRRVDRLDIASPVADVISLKPSREAKQADGNAPEIVLAGRPECSLPSLKVLTASSSRRKCSSATPLPT